MGSNYHPIYVVYIVYLHNCAIGHGGNIGETIFDQTQTLICNQIISMQEWYINRYKECDSLQPLLNQMCYPAQFKGDKQGEFSN